MPADHLKGTSYQTVVSCYFRNGGYHNPPAHADGNQISTYDAGSRATLDMYMVGCRIDVPQIPYECANSAAIFLAPERLGPYGLANYQLSHNWFNGSAGTVRIGSKQDQGNGPFTFLTYAYNRVGYGYQYFAVQISDDLKTTGGIATYHNTMCDSLEVGSVVYYDANGNRVESLSDMTQNGTILVNFANYTKVARDYEFSVVLEDASGNPVMSFDKNGTVRRYIPYSEYAVDSNLTKVEIDGEMHTVLIENPNNPENVGETITLSGLPSDMTGYRLKISVTETTDGGDLLLRTSALTDGGIKENEGIYKKSYLVAFVDANGDVLRYVEVFEGETVSAEAVPTAPTVEGDTFVGWSLDLSAPIYANTAVYATYENGGITPPTTYTVTFLDKDGAVLKTEIVEEGKSATAPIAPSVEGFTFTGWSVDFSAITANLTVKAEYQKDEIILPEPPATDDSAIEAFEAAVQTLETVKNSSLAVSYDALSEAALAFAEIGDQETAKESQAYLAFVSHVQAYNQAVRTIANDMRP